MERVKIKINIKPCSKWHHSTQSRLANQGPQANQTTRTTTTFIQPTTTTTASRRNTNTAKQNKIILTILEPRATQSYVSESSTNLSSCNATEVQTIAIQLKPSQRLLVIASPPNTGQPKIVQIRRQPQPQTQQRQQQQQQLQQQTQQRQQQQQQQQLQQQTQAISLQQTQRARLAARSNRITRVGASAIRVPFLPGLPSTPSTVKQNSLIRKNSNLVTLTSPLKLGDLPKNNRNTITQLTQTQGTTPVATNTPTDTVDYTTVLNSQNQNQNSEIILNSVDNTTTSNYTKLCVPQQQQSLHSSVQFSQTQTQTPRTLAAMAGIQLTGVDEHVSPSSMSGATPTATVEEINVPVFINEYQQQPAATSTAATNINYSLISSSISNNNCHSNSSGIGSDAYSNCDYNNSYNNIINGNEFEDFEFDMEMFEDSSNVEMFSTDSNTNNTTNNSNNNINNNGIGMAVINDNFGICNNNSTANNNNENNYSMYNNTNYVKNEYTDLSQQYLVSCDPLNFDEWQPSQECTISTEFLPDLPDISENAVDFNSYKVLDDFLLNSQNPMFPCASVCSSNNVSQQMEFGNSEPFVPKIEDDEIFCVDDSTFLTSTEPVTAVPISLPSVSTFKNRTRLLNKRMKVLLPTAPAEDPLSTPTVLGGIVDLQDEKMDIESSIYLGNSVANIGDIVESLQDNTSPCTYTDEESPSTPQSGHSFTTSATLYSPAPSNISTNQQTNSNKKKRGRPAKEHSDQPDPAQLKNMPDVDRKKLLDRAKNNEASRVSRRKNKEREEEEKEEERKLIEKNLVLRTRRKELAKIEKKLKRALMRGVPFAL